MKDPATQPLTYTHAWEEILIRRVATEDVLLHGQQIKRGDAVRLAAGAVNRFRQLVR